MTRVIVAGSYPPIPVPAAAATVDAVRRAVSGGRQVQVISPRPSAAHYSVPLVGVMAGRRLNRMRRITGATELVFCLEPAVPFPPQGGTMRVARWWSVVVAMLLARSIRRFQHTTLVLTGDTGAPGRAVQILVRAADEVTEDRRDGDPPAGVTARGPVELRGRDIARRIVGRLARRLTGRQSLLLTVLLGVFVFAVDVASPAGMTADSIRQVSTAVAMVHFHTISLDHLAAYQVNPHVAVTVVHGHIYPYFPWAGALFAVPWVVGYDIAHKLGIGPGSIGLLRQGHDWPIQVLSMSLVVAICTAVVFRIGSRLLESEGAARPRRWAVMVALAFAFCTPVWSSASRSLWEHGPSILCLSVALLLVIRARDGLSGWMGMGAALGSAYAMRPTDAIPVVILGLWVLIWQRRHFLQVLAGALPPLAIFLAVNMVAYGHLLTPYYTQGSGFRLTSTFGTAFAGNLISPNRGLLIFVPLVILSGVGVAYKIRHPFWIALGLIPIAHLILISAFKHWWGGDSYGNRLFTDMMPFFAVLALPAVARLSLRRFQRQRLTTGLVSVAVVWSLFVHGQGATLRSSWCWNNEPTDVDMHPAKVWSWSDPQFVRGVRRLIWGPNRHSELIRDGVDKLGCPTEPVRP